MLERFPVRIHLVRVTVASAPRRNNTGRHASMGWLVATCCASIAGMVAVTPASANATPAPSPSGSTTAQVNIATTSITVTPPGPITFNSCLTLAGGATGSFMNLPTGTCLIPGNTITITNGTQSGHIYVKGSTMDPVGGGTSWTLCGPGGASCTNTNPNSGFPGPDQFNMIPRAATGNLGPFLAPFSQCDTAFNPASTTDKCLAASQASATEGLEVVGPQSSTTTAAQFSTTVTWLAGP